MGIPIVSLFVLDFSYIYAAVDNISTDLGVLCALSAVAEAVNSVTSVDVFYLRLVQKAVLSYIISVLCSQ